MSTTTVPFEPTHHDDTDERLLKAVRAEVLSVGIHRLTATSVARRAGLARVTLYRRSGGVKRLVLSAITLEVESLIESATREIPPGDGLTRTQELTLRLMTGVIASDFLCAIFLVDAALLEPYLTDHLGSSQRALIGAIIPEIENGLDDGTIAPDDPRVLATTLLHALTPFVLATRLTKGELGMETTHRQIIRLIRGYLAPGTPPAPTPPTAGHTRGSD